MIPSARRARGHGYSLCSAKCLSTGQLTVNILAISAVAVIVYCGKQFILIIMLVTSTCIVIIIQTITVVKWSQEKVSSSLLTSPCHWKAIIRSLGGPGDDSWHSPEMHHILCVSEVYQVTAVFMHMCARWFEKHYPVSDIYYIC